MYTDKMLRNELFNISKNKYVKYQLLNDYITNRISQQEFINHLTQRKDKQAINELLIETNRVKQKIASNGGIAPDPITLAKKYNSSRDYVSSYKILRNYLKQHGDDEEAKITLGWTMYNFLKPAENNLDRYLHNLKILNDSVLFEFRWSDEELSKLLNLLLWSIRRVVKQGELKANTIFPEFLRFINYSSEFIEDRDQRLFNDDNNWSSSRSIIIDFSKLLNDQNYIKLFNAIGFDWFDSRDYLPTNFKNSDDEHINIDPLAETILNNYAKKLMSLDKNIITSKNISDYIGILDGIYLSHPEYEWLPYYSAKLSLKLGDKEQAFTKATEFARTRKIEYWIWEIISDSVEGEDKFNCICAALLTKAKPEMIVSLQEKAFQLLVDREMYPEAKLLLDSLIKTRTKKNWKISPELLYMKENSWYAATTVASNLDNLKKYAYKAQKLVYASLPYTNAFVTYINNEKGVIHFQFINDKSKILEGFFYTDQIDEAFKWNLYSLIKIKMVSDSKKANLYNVYDVIEGDTKWTDKFIKKFNGIFDKVYDFGYIRDGVVELYVNKTLVNQFKLLPFSEVSGTMFTTYNKKKKITEYKLISIVNVEEPDPNEFQSEIYGIFKRAKNGFGFVEDCFVPKELIDQSDLEEYGFAKVRAHKSWDRKKNIWSWKAYEIINETSDIERDYT